MYNGNSENSAHPSALVDKLSPWENISQPFIVQKAPNALSGAARFCIPICTSMDTPIIDSYSSIPVAHSSDAAAAATTPPRLSMRPNQWHSVLKRRSSHVLLLVTAVAALAFFTVGKNSVPRLYYNHIVSVDRYFRSIPHLRTNVNAVKVPFFLSNALTPIHSNAKRFGSVIPPRFSPLFRTSGSCGGGDLEDFSLDESVRTGRCGRGKRCIARLVLEKEGSQVTIKGGYNLISRAEPREVNSAEQSKSAALYRSEAITWATKLLVRTQEALAEVNCAVTADQIADSILETTDSVARCPITSDPLCSQLITIQVCSLSAPSSETGSQKQCRKFLESGAEVESLDYLENSSPCAEYFMEDEETKLLFISAPFCTTKCPTSSCPDTDHVVYAPFAVLGRPTFSVSDEERLRLVGSAFSMAYKNLIGNDIRSCDNLPYTSVMAGTTEYMVYTPKETTAALEAFSEQGVEITSVVYKTAPTLDALLSTSCDSTA
ncbi:hypothetical protein FGB62_123g09 [Gracilaria domingensis]|nr:hypothetical protein FGB62_123g09 [Gracilaria domingensis]